MWWPTAAESVSAGDTLGVFLIATFIATLYVLRMRANVSDLSGEATVYAADDAP